MLQSNISKISFYKKLTDMVHAISYLVPHLLDFVLLSSDTFTSQKTQNGWLSILLTLYDEFAKLNSNFETIIFYQAVLNFTKKWIDTEKISTCESLLFTAKKKNNLSHPYPQQHIYWNGNAGMRSEYLKFRLILKTRNVQKVHSCMQLYYDLR